VGRPCPETERLQQAFTKELHRIQRRSDGTIRLEGLRFEIPGRYHHFTTITVRLATWDLSRVYLCDPQSGAILCRLYPQDKNKNAQGQRAARIPPPGLTATAPAPAPGTPAPLLQKLLKDYATTGLPPAYLPKDEIATDSNPS
jgi:hypothetical protein